MSGLPQRIATGVYQITLGGVNAFLIDLDDHGVGAVVPAAGERAAPGASCSSTPASRAAQHG